MTAVLRAFPGHLLAPLQIGPVELANRIVSTAHQTTLIHEHLPTEDFVAYHEARARGGVGLIVLEATAVHESGLLTGHTLAGYLPAIVSGYRTVARAVKPHGSRLFVQLFHGSRARPALRRSRRPPSRAAASKWSLAPPRRRRSTSSSPGTRARPSSQPRAESRASRSRPPTTTCSRSS